MGEVFRAMLLLFLVVCAVAIARTRHLLSAVVLFAAYSLVMAIVWQQMSAPDIAVTEAAIGAGITTILMVSVLIRVREEKAE